MKVGGTRALIWGVLPLILAIGATSFAGQKPTTSPPPVKPEKASPPPTAASPAAPDDPVVLKVGEQKISKGDFDFVLSTLDQNGQQTLGAQGRKPFGDQYVMILILYQQALSEHLDATPDVARELEMGRLRTIAQAEYQHLAEQTAVTPDETEAFYKAHLQDLTDEERDIREVAVLRKPQGAPDNAAGLDDATARARSETIRKALASGADPAKVIQDYAVPNVVLIDAKPNRIRRGQLIASLDKPAFELKDGETSGIIETPQAFVFVQVVAHHTPDLKEATPDIESSIRQQKLNAHLQQLRQGASVWMDDQYFKAPQAATPPAPSVTPRPSSIPTAPPAKP
jgi:parvulin-like peptidyl-prolyl cis-trans isomerase-like protein